MKHVGYVNSVLSRCRGGLIAVVTISFGINVLVLTTSVYMLQVYDRVLPGRSLPTLAFLTAIAVAVLAAMGVLELIRSRILVRIGSWIDRTLSPLAYARGIENAVRGSVYRMDGVRDLSTVCKFLAGNGIFAMCDAPWMPIYLAFVYLLHPVLGHVALCGAAILFILALLNNLATQTALKEAGAVATRNSRSSEAAVRNSEVIDGMGMVGALARRWDRGNAEVLHLQALASDRAGAIAAAAKVFRMTLQIAILGVGAYLVLQNQVTAGSMVAASIVMGRALAPVEQAISTWKQVVGAREAWKRLCILLMQPSLHGRGMPLPRPQGDLVVENAFFTPPGAVRPILRGVGFELKHGEGMAVIGPSAAGKSTLARLLVGSHAPQTGVVRLDGANVFHWSRENFGRHVGYLPQDVELFPGTVAENIARMQEDADPKSIVAAAELAGVHEMILRLPQGYDTQIGEQGAILSGGQRQRIGLARALYGEPALIVLDEPNASLDAAGEQALNQAIKAIKNCGTTVVVIAHRPSLMTHVDKVLVLNDGRVEAFDERDVVLAKLQRNAVQPSEKQQVRAINP